MELKIYRMNPLVPSVEYGTNDSACFDLSACLMDRPSVKGFYANNESVVYIVFKDNSGKHCIKIPPRGRILIPTGMIFDIPKGYCVKVYSRSGLSVKKGLAMTNGLGIVDSDYVEEVFVPMINHSDEELVICHGDRIAQAELLLAPQAQVTYINERPQQKSDRNGGFGSTGVSK